MNDFSVKNSIVGSRLSAVNKAHMLNVIQKMNYSPNTSCGVSLERWTLRLYEENKSRALQSVLRERPLKCNLPKKSNSASVGRSENTNGPDSGTLVFRNIFKKNE